MNRSSITVAELQKMLDEGKEVTILDVRPQDQREEWQIAGSYYKNAYEALNKGEYSVLDNLDVPSGIPVVTVCAAGKTSGIAADALTEKGYQALSLEGGMKAWNYAWNTAEVRDENLTNEQYGRAGELDCRSRPDINLLKTVVMPPILKNKHFASPSVFTPENLLREARRQKGIAACSVPRVCVLDPDGDLATYLKDQGLARKNNCWACYHSKMHDFDLDGTVIGIVPCVVGASYAVLVAEQLFASGCELLISITSAGIITRPVEDRQFALITEAVRDEGTSYHYLPQEANAVLRSRELNRLNGIDQDLWFNAKSWTTDAPYRETSEAIEAMRAEQVVCVEMEAAALYAFGAIKDKAVMCFAHLTNTMAQQEGDFEKGEHFGSIACLDLIRKIVNG